MARSSAAIRREDSAREARARLARAGPNELRPDRWIRAEENILLPLTLGGRDPDLDSSASAEVLGLLCRAADEFGQTIVMVTHDADAASYADGLVVLADGRSVRDEPAGDIDSVLELMKTAS